jgi:hypothetical protein
MDTALPKVSVVLPVALAVAQLTTSWLRNMRNLMYLWEQAVFKPENNYRIFWDIYMMLLILYYAFAVPIRLAFSQDAAHPELEHIFTACFCLDILINFNTALIGQVAPPLYSAPAPHGIDPSVRVGWRADC